MNACRHPILGMLTLCLLVGCSPQYYREKADEDVYAILKKVEEDVFGTSSGFSIDTSTPGRDSASVSAQGLANAGKGSGRLRLSLDETLVYAVKNSRNYQSQKERLYLTALTLTGERHNFRPRFFGRSQADYSRLSDGERQGTVDSSAGFNQALATGGTLGVSIANDLFRYFTGDPRRSAASVLSMNVTQPLLRGAGQKVAAERLTQANRNVVYAIRDYSHFQNTFSVDIVREYFNLLQLKVVIINEYNNYQSRRANVEYLSGRVDRESPESVDNAEQDELEAKVRYIQSITSFRNALDRFKITLGLPQQVDLRLDDNEIKKLRKLGAKPVSLSGSEAFAISLEHRLPLFNQIDRFEDSRRQVAVAADRLKADLSIVGTSSLDNRGDATDYTSFDFSDVRASVGLQLGLPLDRLRERNEYRATLISFESAARDLARDFDELRNLLDRRIRELEQLRETYEIQKNAVVLAQKRVDGNRMRLQAGTVIFRRLSESQDALIAAQNAETSSIVNYLGARLNLLVDLGILETDKKGYWLNENPSRIKNFNSAPSRRQAVDTKSKVISPEELFQ